MKNNELFQYRQLLLDLLEAQGDFRAESKIIGESKLALVAIEYSNREGVHEKDRLDVIKAAHRALFHAL